ncbi:ABC transporter permease [Paenibacillus alkalitolerans]|uniref:ABC transporter permease n=1 Tax=Paenibacillus alkalitolerans TaxID=2799335 RepID=UPI0018F63BF4|nr:ABC transporter permease [Paenibacillus alkalitolerans]
MGNTRWRKMFRDLLSDPGRTLLAVLSISIGVAGVSLIGQTLHTLNRGMAESYEAANPSDAVVFTSGFDGSVLDAVREADGVASAEGRFAASVRMSALDSPAAEDWRKVQLVAIDDFSSISSDRLLPEQGSYPPGREEALFERTALSYYGLSVGDTVWLETPGGTLKPLRISGTARDPVRETASLSGTGYVYITLDTLNDFGFPRLYNAVSFAIADTGETEAGRLTREIERTAAAVRDVLYARNIQVHTTNIPEPGKHWGADIVGSMIAILQTLGTLALLLGMTLVVNTVLAILGGQLRQIGVMKVIGATPRALFAMYSFIVIMFGALAIAAGLPLGLFGASAVMAGTNELLNFDSSGYGYSPQVIVAAMFIGVCVPFLAAALPIYRGIRISVREAIQTGGAGGERFGTGWIDRLLERARGLPRPLMLSLRNTFRRKGRLALTITTLSLSGAIVVSVISIYASMDLTLERSLQYAGYDLQIAFPSPQPKSRAEQAAASVEGVAAVEGWGASIANRVREDGSESVDWSMAAPPPGTELMTPIITDGRWLTPDDRNAIVIDSYIFNDDPGDIRAGDTVTFEWNGKPSEWKVVGILRKVVGKVESFVSYDAWEQTTGLAGQISHLHIVTAEHDRVAQARTAEKLQAALEAEGIPVAGISLTSEYRELQQSRFGIMLGFLAVMGTLLTVVSTLGLLGCMSINVMERTRDFGILRSIGATNRSIWSIVVAEGMIVGLIGWAAGSLLAVPVSKLLADAVGESLFKNTLDYVFPAHGILLWFGGALVCSAAASFLPAWRASRLAMREVLAFE